MSLMDNLSDPGLNLEEWPALYQTARSHQSSPPIAPLTNPAPSYAMVLQAGLVLHDPAEAMKAAAKVHAHLHDVHVQENKSAAARRKFEREVREEVDAEHADEECEVVIHYSEFLGPHRLKSKRRSSKSKRRVGLGGIVGLPNGEFAPLSYGN